MTLVDLARGPCLERCCVTVLWDFRSCGAGYEADALVTVDASHSLYCLHLCTWPQPVMHLVLCKVI